MENVPAVIEKNEVSLAAYAMNLEAKLQMCEVLLKSGVVPSSYKSREAIFAVVMMGQEYGFGPMKSLELFDFIQGRACMRVAGMLAKVQQNGGTFKTIKETEKECTLEAKRAGNGWTETYTFDWTMAEKMGLVGKDNWRKMPKFMLYARCVSVLVRRGWADIMGGLYSSEEIQDSDMDNSPIITAAEIQPDPVRMAETHKAIQEQAQPQASTPNHSYEWPPVKALYAGLSKQERAEAWKEAVEKYGVHIDAAADMVTTSTEHPDWEAYRIKPFDEMTDEDFEDKPEPEAVKASRKQRKWFRRQHE